MVPDYRLDFLNELYKPKSLVPTTFEFTDIAGLVKGASNGEGLGNKFLSHIREVDAICEVVRCFDDTNIIHVENEIDPIRDIEIIAVELILADLDIVDNRLSKIEKKAKMSKDKESLKEVDLLHKLKECLESNKAVRTLELDEDEKLIMKPYNLLTAKPIIYVANLSEEEISNKNNEYLKRVIEYAKSEGAKVISVCAKIEEELCDLSDEEKKELLSELGVESSGLDKLIQATYSLLGLKTFFTSGTDEVRAWTFTTGMKAPDCAGIIHTDFKRGFIRAEVMSFEDLEKYKDEKIVKEKGKVRLEGKEYLMQDGDICYFRFNV